MAIHERWFSSLPDGHVVYPKRRSFLYGRAAILQRTTLAAHCTTNAASTGGASRAMDLSAKDAKAMTMRIPMAMNTPMMRRRVMRHQYPAVGCTGRVDHWFGGITLIGSELSAFPTCMAIHALSSCFCPLTPKQPQSCQRKLLKPLT